MDNRYRLRFSKTGRAVYISHLDLMRTMQRAFSRAGLQLKYSEGFNPHPVMSILMPLSVGCASECELMDFRLTREFDPEEITQRLHGAFPEGITPLYTSEQKMPVKNLKWLLASGRLDYDDRDCAAAAAALNSFFQRSEINVAKKSKSGETLIDLAPNLRKFSAEAGQGSVSISCVLSAQQPTLNPELLVKALAEAGETAWVPDFAAFTRKQFYTENFEIFE